MPNKIDIEEKLGLFESIAAESKRFTSHEKKMKMHKEREHLKIIYDCQQCNYKAKAKE